MEHRQRHLGRPNRAQQLETLGWEYHPGQFYNNNNPHQRPQTIETDLYTARELMEAAARSGSPHGLKGLKKMMTNDVGVPPPYNNNRRGHL